MGDARIDYPHLQAALREAMADHTYGRVDFTRAYRVNALGYRWEFGTNARLLMAVANPECLAPKCRLDASLFFSYPARVDPIQTTVGHLQRWVGDYELTDCEECDGSGCLNCDAGKCPAVRLGTYAGHRLDLNMLAKVLRVLPADMPVAVEIAATVAQNAFILRLVGHGWRLFQVKTLHDQDGKRALEDYL
jgi:hypothetical protein